MTEPRRMYPLWRAYDVMAALILLPVVAVLAMSLPDDLANHNGDTRRGTATIIKVEPLRGGLTAVYEVRSATGDVVGVTEDIYGFEARAVGASAPVNYLAPDSSDSYVAAWSLGEDPLWINAAILAVTGTALLVALGFVARRGHRLLNRRRELRPYRANVT